VNTMNRRDLFRLAAGGVAAFLLRTYGRPQSLVKWLPFTFQPALEVRLDPGGHELRAVLATYEGSRPIEEVVREHRYLALPEARNEGETQP